MPKGRTWTDNEMKQAIANSGSARQVLIVLGLRPVGGNYRTVKEFIIKNSIDVSHFHGQLWNKGKKIGPKRPLEDYLSGRIKIKSYSLKRRLLSEGLKEHICESCNQKEWMDGPIPLELDHIDGDNANNELKNIRLLCPNCHALTPTYRGRNIGRGGENRTRNPFGKTF